MSSSLVGKIVEFFDQEGTNLLRAFNSSSLTLYKALAPSTKTGGTTVTTPAKPVNLLQPVP